MIGLFIGFLLMLTLLTILAIIIVRDYLTHGPRFINFAAFILLTGGCMYLVAMILTL